MPHNRFFLDHDFSLEDAFVLKETEAHHLSRVMRGKVGDQVELVNGKNQLLHGIVEAIDKNQVTIRKSDLIASPLPKSSLILVQSVVEMSRLENIVEKTTELGIDEIWLIPAVLSEKKELSVNQQKRLDHIAVAAMKQSGRLTLPKISVKDPLSKWKALDNATLYYGDLEGKTLSLPSEQLENTVLFFIGPESGWHDKERAHLNNVLKAKPVLFHRNTLRTDTAAIFLTGLLRDRL